MIFSNFCKQTTNMHLRQVLLTTALIALLPGILLADIGANNPTGTSGVFNKNVTTACSYDPYTGNATRSVTDLVFSGGVGAYPLAFTRTMNSRYTAGAASELGAAGNWRHSYQWSIDSRTYPKTYLPSG